MYFSCVCSWVDFFNILWYDSFFYFFYLISVSSQRGSFSMFDYSLGTNYPRKLFLLAFHYSCNLKRIWGHRPSSFGLFSPFFHIKEYNNHIKFHICNEIKKKNSIFSGEKWEKRWKIQQRKWTITFTTILLLLNNSFCLIQIRTTSKVSFLKKLQAMD